MGDGSPLFAPGPSSATNDDGGGQTSTRMASVFTLSVEQTSLNASCSYRMAALWARIMDIPVRILIDNILPYCAVKDAVSLGCTNKFFALIATDETFWKRKLAVDYNFPVLQTARASGWKFLYQRLRNPRVFVWGCVTFMLLSCCEGVRLFVNALMRGRWDPFRWNHHGQLGLPRLPKTTRGDVPFPVELRIPGVRVVSLVASAGSVQIPLLCSTYLIVPAYQQGYPRAWL